VYLHADADYYPALQLYRKLGWVYILEFPARIILYALTVWMTTSQVRNPEGRSRLRHEARPHPACLHAQDATLDIEGLRSW
jgi:hypothetical protein